MKLEWTRKTKKYKLFRVIHRQRQQHHCPIPQGSCGKIFIAQPIFCNHIPQGVQLRYCHQGCHSISGMNHEETAKVWSWLIGIPFACLAILPLLFDMFVHVNLEGQRSPSERRTWSRHPWIMRSRMPLVEGHGDDEKSRVPRGVWRLTSHRPRNSTKEHLEKSSTYVAINFMDNNLSLN